jgi:hypothetical protein
MHSTLLLLLVALRVFALPNSKAQDTTSPLHSGVGYQDQAKPVYHPALFGPSSLHTQNTPQLDEAPETHQISSDGSSKALSTFEETEAQNPEPHVPAWEKTMFVLHHSDNDNLKSLEVASRYHTSQPICSFFQHSVLGDDFGQNTFPRVSYDSSDPLPYHVHYDPADERHYESYKWPFAACNRACEQQALTIRALFDWELDSTNKESGLDEETKTTLMLAREICQWKNAQQLLRIPQQTNDNQLRKRTEIDADQENVQTHFQANVVCLSPEARLALQEIRGILQSTYGPEDLREMFHTVIIACKIHRYTRTPMSELVVTGTDQMIQQAMAQIERVFIDTQGIIDVWETRDAIVRATQIYRYQEEQSRSR